MPIGKTRLVSGLQFPRPPQNASPEEVAFYSQLRQYIDSGFRNLQLPDFNPKVYNILTAASTGIQWAPQDSTPTTPTPTPTPTPSPTPTPTPTPTPPPSTVFYPMAVWWQNIANIGYWVNPRFVNVFMWDNAISFTHNDFLNAHNAIEAIRQTGIDVRVVRKPAYLLVPDTLDATFDMTWYAKGHIYAFAYTDEYEDKIPGGGGGNVLFAPQVLTAAFAKVHSDYDNWVISMGLTPGKIRYFCNFNGSHISANTKTVYTNIINSGSRAIDILCSDNYPCDNQQTYTGTPPPTVGTKLYPDVVGAMTNGPLLLKQWAPQSEVWGFLESCNQAQHTAGAPGWAPGWTFDGSRAPTSAELLAADAAWTAGGVIGRAWFPQSGGGTVNDATASGLIPTIIQIDSMHTSVLGPPSQPPTSTNTGTVQSVGLVAPAEFIVTNSPVTNTGNLTFSKATQVANVFFGTGTSTGTVPIFRPLPGGGGGGTATIVAQGTVQLSGTTTVVTPGITVLETDLIFLTLVAVPGSDPAFDHTDLWTDAGEGTTFNIDVDNYTGGFGQWVNWMVVRAS